MAKKKKEELTLEDRITELNKRFGKGTIITEDKEVKYDVISSGSIGVDYDVLGVGGFIKGCLYEIRGWESVGKSTLSAYLVSNCQKQGGKVLYVDGEHAVDLKYFRTLGVDTSNWILAQPDYGEAGFEIAYELISSGDIDLVIIDSDSTLIPKSVIENPMEASNLGKKAKLNSNAYPRIKNALKRNNVCVVVISQYREKIGVMFGDPKTTQGGNCLKYTADTIIEMSRKQAKDDGETYGNITKFKTIKNKSYSPYKVTEFELVFGEGIDTKKELIELAIKYNIIEQSGSSYSYEGNKLARGLNALKTVFEDNPEFLDDIKQKLLEQLKLKTDENNSLPKSELPSEENAEEHQKEMEQV